jgi:hypothetical protein
MKWGLRLSRAFGLFLFLAVASSCHPTSFTVGKGAEQHHIVKQKNKFLFLGLVHTGIAPDTKEMSNHASDYTITVKLTFTDVLLNVITLGIYSPLTVQVEY